MTTLNPDEFKLNRALQSATGFDEIALHIDPGTIKIPHIDLTKITPPVNIISSESSLKVNQAYDLIISEIQTDWICCFCDDDFFDAKALNTLIQSIRNTDFLGADVVHFKVNVSGETPYHTWGAGDIDLPSMEKANMIPAGSFFRKSVWEKNGGFRGELYHDWIFWLRAIKNGCKFRFFDTCVYWFMMRQGSAAFRQIEGLTSEEIRAKVLEYASQ